MTHLCHMLPEHTSRHIREDTCSEKYTNPCKYTTSCLITLTHYQTDTTNSHYLGEPVHSPLTPPDALGHVPEMDTQPGDTLRHIGSTHTDAGTHTNPRGLITHRR